MRKFILFLYGLFSFVQAQISGNMVIQNNEYEPRSQSTISTFPIQKLYLNDSSFVIEAKVLKHVRADYYIIVFGLNQEGRTVQECHDKINQRIQRFISNIQKQGIPEQDIYTDLLTQNRIYDFKENNGILEEYLKGFELGKNVIIKYKNPNLAEKFFSLAAQDSIFDLVKVDYVIEDQTKLYDELFSFAEEIILKKKNRYTKLTQMQLLPQAQIYGESFLAYYPANLYKSYKAFAQNSFDNDSWRRDRNTKDIKRLHKFQTFYYDSPKIQNIDKEIFSSGVEPTIEVILTLQVKYNLAK